MFVLLAGALGCEAALLAALVTCVALLVWVILDCLLRAWWFCWTKMSPVCL